MKKTNNDVQKNQNLNKDVRQEAIGTIIVEAACNEQWRCTMDMAADIAMMVMHKLASKPELPDIEVLRAVCTALGEQVYHEAIRKICKRIDSEEETNR